MREKIAELIGQPAKSCCDCEQIDNDDCLQGDCKALLEMADKILALAIQEIERAENPYDPSQYENLASIVNEVCRKDGFEKAKQAILERFK